MSDVGDDRGDLVWSMVGENVEVWGRAGGCYGEVQMGWSWIILDSDLVSKHFMNESY